MALIDFICDSNNSASIESLINNFIKFLSNYGIDRFIIGDLSHNQIPDEDNNYRILAIHPEECLNYYSTNQYFDYIPVYQKILKARIPFAWKEIKNENISEKILRIIDESEEYGNGIAVPIHLTLGRTVGIGFSSSGKNIRCDKDTLSLLHAASHQFFMVYSNLLNPEKPDNTAVELTDREREVLLWIANGKSKSETANIMSVSESSIKRHCEKIFYKLDVKNLPSAVAKALRFGLIINFLTVF